MSTVQPPLLQVESLSVSPAGGRRVVDGISLQLERGRILGIAGESGCGKTQLLLALLGLSPRGALVQGQIRWQGQALYGQGPKVWQSLRGDRIAMVFQDPMTSLNPYLTIATQLCEVWHCHRPQRRTEAQPRALRLLQAVGLQDPQLCLTQYPHQLSGGMRQRVVLAMALMCEPDLLLADEPTTALDVTVQAQILDLLLQLRERLGMALIVVTHDMGVLAQLADDVLVMESGRVVEKGPVQQMFAQPQAAATQRLLQAAQQLQIATPDARGNAS